MVPAASGAWRSISSISSGIDTTGPSRLWTGAPSTPASLARTNASPTSDAYCICTLPPNGIR